MKRVFMLSVCAIAFPSIGHGQTPSRWALIEDWKHQQQHTLAVIDSSTDAMLGFRTTPGVRNFAEQIDHIAASAAMIVSMGVAGMPVPAEVNGDTAVYLHDRAKLRVQAKRYFDYVISTLSTIPDSQFATDASLFGGSMPRYRWNLAALQHSAWTLGQTVPYLRMNGRIPPMFTPF